MRTFRQRFEQVRPLLDARPRAGGVRELVALASIVEKEAQLEPERPLIAAVYHNRIDRGMGLQADPTVIFALKRLGRWNGNLRRDDLRLDSPYNTYRYAGLPPGPICSPGLASLRAAGDPADAPYLYFVSRNDGTHVFAETLADHNRNVERWQRRYWRERRAAERRPAGNSGAPSPRPSPTRGEGATARPSRCGSAQRLASDPAPPPGPLASETLSYRRRNLTSRPSTVYQGLKFLEHAPRAVVLHPA